MTRDECQVVTGNPEDHVVLATSRRGRVDYLVTGDRRIPDLNKFAVAKVGAVSAGVAACRDIIAL